MKVIEINATYGLGSTGLIVKDIGKMLEANGGEARFVYQFGECDGEKGYRIGNKRDWKLHALYTRISGKQAYASKGATKRLLEYLDAEKPDVVHLHNLHANYINLPMLLKYLAQKDIATVITLHDCWFFTGKCCHFVFEGCERWKTGCGHCPVKNKSPKSLFFDRSARVLKDRIRLFSDIKRLSVVGCSKWIASLAAQSPVFRHAKIDSINNGVDTSVFYMADREECRKKHGISGSFVAMGMANKWLLPQNREVMVKIIGALGEDDKLLLLGCSKEQIDDLSKNPKIIAVGFIRSREEIAEYYNAANVFINLTFEDTLPTVNMEAICCGAPVITYDSCGSPELVIEGETGYVVKKLDYNGIIEKIKLIKENTVDRSSCAQTGKKQFCSEENYKKYMDIFKNL